MSGMELEKWHRQPNVVGLSTDIDLRLADLFTALWAAGELVPEVAGENVVQIVGSAIRQAYVRGYADALQEDSEGARSTLFIDNGYAAV